MRLKLSLRTLVATSGIAVAGLFSTFAHADLFVISHSGTQVAAGEIKEVFTGEKQYAGSIKLIPIDNGPAQEAFLSSALRMEASRYNTIWTKKSFREGLNPPSVKSGDNDVLDFIRRTPGAVGYVSSQPSGVNIIHKY